MRTYLIWSIEHHAWWKAGLCGYTQDLNEAGYYDEEQAVRICTDANTMLGRSRDTKPPSEAMVPIDEFPWLMKKQKETTHG